MNHFNSFSIACGDDPLTKRSYYVDRKADKTKVDFTESNPRILEENIKTFLKVKIFEIAEENGHVQDGKVRALKKSLPNQLKMIKLPPSNPTTDQNNRESSDDIIFVPPMLTVTKQIENNRFQPYYSLKSHSLTEEREREKEDHVRKNV